MDMFVSGFLFCAGALVALFAVAFVLGAADKAVKLWRQRR